MLNSEITISIATDQHGSDRETVTCIPGQTVLEVLQAANITLNATCGGRGTCGKCRVLIEDSDGLNYRLACRTLATSGMLIIANEPKEMLIQETGNGLSHEVDEGGEGYAVAIDVGTTTVVCRLFDLTSGAVRGVASSVNPQVVFGADVMSRIDASIAGKLTDMQVLLLDTLRDLIVDLCKAAGISLKDVVRIGLAANTVMEHIAAGLPPDSIGVAPFTPLSLFNDEHHFKELPVPVWFAPAIYGYVGGDITAGILATAMDKAARPQLLVDLGTNGEIALGDSSGILCAATAAGPVFEGAGIHFGMPALPGAVATVKLSGDDLELSVIGNEAPLGICGSGLIDIVALLRNEGVLDAGGRMVDRTELSEFWAARSGEENGVKVIYLTLDHSLYITQIDVRQLQLAKGAICAGINTLLEKLGISTADIETLQIAGGFGRALDLKSAAVIGLFPAELLDCAVSAGNTAIEGISAAMLSSKAKQRLGQLTELCTYIELSADARFNELFIEALGFS
ncbi:MAG: DUF4445 domain-containing protein [Coriobacteriaceae bacterium]|nr:DUF4445 domain-containing protein [Coriobacteriaceae bacterium]